MSYKDASGSDFRQTRERDVDKRAKFAVWDTIICVSLELPEGWLVSLRFQGLSQTETVSTIETLGRLGWQALQLRFGGRGAPGGHGISEAMYVMRASQKGLLAEWPQRQRLMAVRPARPKGFPSGSTISKSPSTRMDPLCLTVIFVVAIFSPEPHRVCRYSCAATSGND